MTTISILGVAVGVATLIIVLSIMGGFENNLHKRMLRGEPHFEIFAQNVNAGFSRGDLNEKTVKKRVPEAVAIQSFTRADVVLKHRRNLQAAVIVGLEPAEKNDMWVYASSMIQGDVDVTTKRFPATITEDRSAEGDWPGIILGDGLADTLGANLGDEVLVVNPLTLGEASDALNTTTTMRRYVLAGIFSSGDSNFDNKWAVVNLEEGRKFMADYDPSLDEEDYVTGIALNIANPFEAQSLSKRFSDLNWVKTSAWQEVNSALLFALKLEKFTMGAILMLIVVVAAFSISGTLMMGVFHRQAQVRILRALGMTQRGIVNLFLVHGLLIGGVGILAGLLFGLSVCYGIHNLRFFALPEGIYAQTQIPLQFLPSTYVVICVGAFLFTLFAAVYPAITASRLGTRGFGKGS